MKVDTSATVYRKGDVAFLPRFVMANGDVVGRYLSSKHANAVILPQGSLDGWKPVGTLVKLDTSCLGKKLFRADWISGGVSDERYFVPEYKLPDDDSDHGSFAGHYDDGKTIIYHCCDYEHHQWILLPEPLESTPAKPGIYSYFVDYHELSEESKKALKIIDEAVSKATIEDICANSRLSAEISNRKYEGSTCECGAAKAKSAGHSSWCPMHGA